MVAASFQLFVLKATDRKIQIKLFFALIVSLCFTGFGFSQGAKLTPIDVKFNIEKLDRNIMGFSADIPRRYSMEKYVPPVSDQGDTSTCVGFSALYYSLSTMYNIAFEYTSYQDRFANAFDPYFLYSILNNYKDGACDEGLYVYEAVEKINSLGAKKRWISPITKCNTNWSSSDISRVKKYTYPFRIDSFYDIPPKEVEVIKEAIYHDMPVTGLFALTDSFDSERGWYGGESRKGLWNPGNSEQINGYHAMTLVGYDDFVFGGSFRVVNSWGDDYGDEGYLWIPYDVFVKKCEEAYAYSVDFEKNINSTNDEFERYDNDDGVYEGEYINNDLNGYATWYSFETKSYYFGFLNKGSWDGFHVVITPDELKYGEMTNGYFNEYGFADEENLEKERDLKEYFGLFDIKNITLQKIRKANSTKKMPTKR